MANESKIKHLEFIQLTITRMNVNSFIVKGWVVTLVAAVFVLSGKEANTNFLWVTPVITLLFWFLDAFYVSTERSFRSLYDDIRVKNDADIDYSMDISSYYNGINSYIRSVCSLTLMLFYPTVFVFSIIGSSVLNH